jgi:hypothetical protein
VRRTGSPRYAPRFVRALALTLLLASLPVAARGADAPFDPDFDPEPPVRSLALGPVPSGDAMLSLDVGWLHSALRADLGITSFVGLVLVADTMLLYRGTNGETSVRGGVRLSPVAEGAFRLSIDATAGQVYIPAKVGSDLLTVLRGDLVAGVTLTNVTVYGRVALIGLGGSSVPGRPGFARQQELGLGVETPWRRFVFAGEAFVWARPGHTGFPMWRLRAGIVF